MRAARLGLSLSVGVLALAGALRCAYAPDPPSGELKCASNGECPDGYSCSNSFCYKNSDVQGHAGTSGQAGGTAGVGGSGTAGTGGRGGAGGTGAAGTGAAGTGAAGATGVPCAGSCTIKIDGTLANANPPSTTDKFVGHWVFAAGSSELVSCIDGSNKTTDLTNDYVDMTLVTDTLHGNYFCDWLLAPGPAGNATVLRPVVGQMCSRTVTDPKTGMTKFTWHGMTFTFKTDDGKAGTLVSTVGVDYVDDSSKTGCTP
jgi:hypothetical protein